MNQVNLKVVRLLNVFLELRNPPQQHLFVCLVTVVLSPLIAVFFSGCSHQPASSNEVSAEPSAPRFPAVIHTAREEAWPTTIQIQGSLIADERAVVGAKVAGRITRVNVDLGSAVKKDDSLVVLEAEEFDLQVRQAEAELAEACAAVGLRPDDDASAIEPEETPFVLVEKALLKEAQNALERSRQLVKSNAISASEIERQIALERVASARFQAALHDVEERLSIIKVRRAKLALAQQNRRDAVVRAPFDGIVQTKHVSNGVYVQPGSPLVTLVRTDPVRFQGSVPERKVLLVAVGQRVEIQVESLEQPLVAKIDRISPALDEDSRSLQVEADIPNPNGRFRAGLFSQARIVVDPDATKLQLPDSAVGEFAGVFKVWLVHEGKSIQQRITIGRHEGGKTEIIDGLRPGDKVIRNYNKGRAGFVDVSPAAEVQSIE